MAAVLGLTALDNLGFTIGGLPGSGSYADLLDRFATDSVMSAYLVIYVVGHLVTYVLLGAALRRAEVIPGWAAWSIIASSPATVAKFVLPGTRSGLVGFLAVGPLVIGSLPARLASRQTGEVVRHGASCRPRTLLSPQPTARP